MKPVLHLFNAIDVHGLAHITGGGLTENIPRILPEGLAVEIDTSSWQQGEVFDWLMAAGNVERAEMRRTFNCGVGMAIVVSESDVNTAIELLRAAGETAWSLGRVVSGDGEVAFI